MTIRTLIVDDEPLAREGVRMLLSGEEDVEIVGEAESGEDAVEQIESLRPDLVFLDIQMPGLNGFDVIEQVGVERMPNVVFVTAYDQFALRAFDAHAVDYVLKPLDRRRLARAMERVRARLAPPRQPGTEESRLEALLAEIRTLATPRRYLERFAVRSHARTVFVPAAEVDYIAADGNYARLHVGKTSYLVRETMARLEERLDPAQFVRLHRSTIARIDRIRETQLLFHGEYRVTLVDGTQLVASRRAKSNLDRLMG